MGSKNNYLAVKTDTVKIQEVVVIKSHGYIFKSKGLIVQAVLHLHGSQFSK